MSTSIYTLISYQKNIKQGNLENIAHNWRIYIEIQKDIPELKLKLKEIGIVANKCLQKHLARYVYTPPIPHTLYYVSKEHTMSTFP